MPFFNLICVLLCPMKLIADSGSTKTDWVLTDGAAVRGRFQTQGLNPFHQSEDDIMAILRQELLPQLPNLPSFDVFFYGSGCTPAHVPMMKQILSEVFSPQNIEVHSDLTAAARALCQYEPGIACILGTGANSCLYDGNEIVQNTPALGYILGDEGSGSVLGRLFMNAIFKNPKFADIRDEYLKQQKLTQADIINKVYREPMPNRFLATTSLYIKDHIDNPLLCDLVVQNFRQFFRSNIVPYQHPELPVHFVGSMAFIYRDQLVQAAEAEGFHVGHTLQSPMEGLVMYHEKGIDASY